MRIFSYYCLVLTLTASLASAAIGATELPPAVVGALEHAGIPLADVSIYVQDVEADEPLMAFSAEEPRNPASTMKLVTTLAGLELLGPDYRWKTEVYTNGEIHAETLEGDLYIRGQGDPSLSLERFQTLISEVRKLGIKEIKGDVVLDRSYFDIPEDAPLSFDNHPNETYNCLPDALLVNLNSVELKISATGPQNHQLIVSSLPKLPQVSLVNELKPLPVACRGGRVAIGARGRGNAARHVKGSGSTRLVSNNGKTERPATRHAHRVGHSAKRTRRQRTSHRARTVFVRARPQVQVMGDREHATVRFAGYYPVGCGETTYTTRVLGAVQYTYGAFMDAWSKAGGQLAGGLRLGKVPDGAKLVATTQSDPLSDIVYAINKNSNNPMARQLFLTLGNHQVPPPATYTKASAAVKEWLSKQGLNNSSLVMENGSGLSHEERISASQLGRMLKHAYKANISTEFVTSLPIVSVDGTMRHRLRNRPVAGHAHIKTGSLKGVKAIAGYVHDRQGRTLAVVFIANRPGAGAASQAQDELIAWLYERA